MEQRHAEFITLAEAAKRYDVSTDTVRRRLIAARVTVFRDGLDRRRCVVRRTDLERAFAPRAMRAA